jgi:hypothetical protein
VKLLCELGLAEFSIGGHRLRQRSVENLRDHRLELDIDGREGGYDLHVTCSDVVHRDELAKPPDRRRTRTDPRPRRRPSRLVMKLPRLIPLWLAGTARTGLSGVYEKFCVASEGYRDLFVTRGARRERLVVTGIPNFDDERNAPTPDRVRDHGLRPFLNRGGALEGGAERRKIVPVDALYVPAEAPKLGLEVAERTRLLDEGIGLELVVIDDRTVASRARAALRRVPARRGLSRRSRDPRAFRPRRGAAPRSRGN